MHLYGLICVCICILKRVRVWFAYSHAGFDLVQPTVSELLFIFPPVYVSVCVYVCVWARVGLCVPMLTCSICPCPLKHISTLHNFSQVCVCVCLDVCVCQYVFVTVFVVLRMCLRLSQQGTCRCSLFNVAGFGDEQVTSQTLFSQHTSRSHRNTQTTIQKVTVEK